MAASVDQPHLYTVADADGEIRARLFDKAEALASASVVMGFDTGFRVAVPGMTGPAGEGVSLLVQGTFGQAVGGQSAIYALATDGSSEPIGRAAIEVPAGGHYVMFSGMTPLDTPTVPPSNDELVASAKAFANSPAFAQTAKVMASLSLHPEKVKAVGCFGTKYKFKELTGISCDDAKATLDRVEKTGTQAGARSVETADYICFYASYGESQTGKADVICSAQTNSGPIAFEAWLK